MPNLHLALEMFHNSVCMSGNVHVKPNISTQCSVCVRGGRDAQQQCNATLLVINDQQNEFMLIPDHLRLGVARSIVGHCLSDCAWLCDGKSEVKTSILWPY